ncbi:MAG: HAD-IC family P-type ATPase [Acidimicrobiales bacterium]|nr:HAD-IC family P-type ATPase [Acidimicrobiales bacterium]MDP7209900.1 HAD-IC family P-type ATPase [Acidimicrobiales bacterium]HJO99226.1 HAD-IC family P-type ATPase [Acidimicrobiales bacterium]
MNKLLEAPSGLSSAEVAERIADGRVNDVPDAPVRTTREILRANVLTPVNAIMGTLLALILVAGFPGDALFAGVIVSNSVIGVIQELKARRTLTNLALLSAPRARVVRDGTPREVAVSQVVADDVMELAPGDQVVVDGDVLSGVGLEIDESLLTGEADPVDKATGDPVLSGSFVSAGSGHYVATRIGADSYAASLAEEARRFKLADSELRSGVNTILRWLTAIIPPAAGLLALRLLITEDLWEEALRGTVAAAVAMVPDGLVLLTSLSFIVGVIALARRQALAKELSSVELLARVDTLCLDKTGTITTGEISFGRVEVIGSTSETDATAALGAMAAADPSPNATLSAVAAACPDPGWTTTSVTPFSSAHKWAAAEFADHGVYHLGAPDVLLPEGEWATARARVAEHADTGYRILVLTRASTPAEDTDSLPKARAPLCLVLLEDTVKEDAPEILEYFIQQGVDLKVISGDHPATVAAVARRAGIPDAETGFDGRDLPSDPDELADLLAGESVFGRVTPHQKRAMIAALQSRGHTVAMTGDGVNDVLALKDADMGIAMGSGSSATRAVAQLVLLDDRFSTLPRVLAEGRRVINNIERVANLFISKATYAVLLTALVAIIGSPFPFLPKQLTLIGTVSIGVPGFFLALAPDTSLVDTGFLKRVLRYSLPAGVAAAISTFACYEIVRRGDSSLAEARTAATMALLVVGLMILVSISRPLRTWKLGLAAAMASSYAGVLALPAGRDYFELVTPGSSTWAVVAICSTIGGLLVAASPRLLESRQ